MTDLRAIAEDRHRRLHENANPDCDLCLGAGVLDVPGPTPGKGGPVACSWCFGFGDVDPMRPIWPGADDD